MRHLPTYWPDEPQHGAHRDEELVREMMTERDYAPAGTPPLVAAARRDDARMERISADRECLHGRLPGDPGEDCGCWRRAA